MLKVIVLAVIFTIGLITVFIYLWVRTAPSLPHDIEKTISNVIALPLPELVTGQAGYTQSGEVNIWYQSKEPALKSDKYKKGVVLLINGLGASALFWPPEVHIAFLEAGFQVITTDNRGLGESDWVLDQKYDLNDMVKDNLAVLDELGIYKAHILGISMGGMIAQEMAIAYPERVISMTSVMSSGFANDPKLPIAESIKHNMIKVFIRYGLIQTDENLIKLVLSTYNLLKGDRDIDIERLSVIALYEIRRRKGFNHKAIYQQAKAIARSGSRYEALPLLTTPTLVIHGRSDPLLDIAHASKYAKLIPGAQTLWIDGMGHAMEPTYVEIWMDKVVQFINAHNEK